MARRMKDSGVAWIGQVPAGWEVKPIRTGFEEVKAKNTLGEEKKALRFNMGTIIPKTNFDAEENETIAETILNYTIVQSDDLIINGLNLNYDLISQRVAIVKEPGIITSAYIIFRNIRQDVYDTYYMLYLLKGYDAYKVFHNMGEGVRKILSFNILKRQPILMPPLAEQKQIAEFLDRECGKLDALVEKVKAQIAQLEACKKSIIAEAVTKGVRSGKRKLKDSGVEWIGQVPTEWEVKRVKYVASIQNGSDPETEGDIPVYGSSGKAFKTCGEYKMGPTILLGRKGTLNAPSYIVGKYWNVDTAFDVRMKDENHLRWFYYDSLCFDIDFYSSQTTIPSMTQTDYYNFSVAVPPLAEQKEIAEYLDKQCGKIDGLIKKSKEQLEKLAEYKKSLIYEYVTGKKEVSA